MVSVENGVSSFVSTFKSVCEIKGCGQGTNKVYCKNHECKNTKCKILALKYDYCKNHECEFKNCHDTKKNSKVSYYCVLHSCKYAQLNNFGTKCINNHNCKQHMCQKSDCYNLLNLRNGGFNYFIKYCENHECIINGCNDSKHNFVEPTCKKHKCKVENCKNKRYDLNSLDNYCDFHYELNRK